MTYIKQHTQKDTQIHLMQHEKKAISQQSNSMGCMAGLGVFTVDDVVLRKKTE